MNLTLWDIFERGLQRLAGPKPAPPRAAEPRSRSATRPPPKAPGKRRPTAAKRAEGPAAKRYADMTKAMLATHSVRVRKWRSSMSGVAWEVHYEDGTMTRLIEAPRPKGPMSAAIFLHEIGHHAIGFHTYKPRCLEEYHAWMFALQQMETLGIEITDRVRHRVHASLHYAVAKAKRRNIREIPAELIPYLERPPRLSKRR